ncbi:MAG: YaaL family protein [Caldibacillus sp.]
MIFRKKRSLKRKYDLQLLEKLAQVKKEWNVDTKLNEQSLEKNEDLAIDIKISRAKYVFLLKEAKERKIRLSRKYF